MVVQQMGSGRAPGAVKQPQAARCVSGLPISLAAIPNKIQT